MYFKNILLTVFLIPSLFGATSAFSEIETVVISWAPGLCLESCRRNAESRFSSMPQVAEAVVSPGSDTATFRWKPTARFSFEDLNFAVRGVGLRVDSLIIKVRGLISHDSRNVFLTSLEDGTVFLLLGRIDVEPSMTPIQNSVYSRQLSPALRDRLIKAQNEYKVVTVVGPIFEPNRNNTNLQLIVQTMSETPSLRQ